MKKITVVIMLVVVVLLALNIGAVYAMPTDNPTHTATYIYKWPTRVVTEVVKQTPVIACPECGVYPTEVDTGHGDDPVTVVTKAPPPRVICEGNRCWVVR